MTGIKYESNEMQNVKSRNIKIVLAIMMISFCWMKTLDAQIIPTDGLIAYYSFTGNTDDESGKENHAISFNVTSTADRCGFSNSAYYFSGTYTYISLPPADFTSMDEYSYSLWFRADSLPSPTVDHWILFAAGSVTEGNEQALTIQSDGSLIGSSSNTGPNPHVTIIRTTPVQTGRWIHVVLIRDLVRLKIFIDAVPMANISNLDSLVNNQHADYGSDNQTATIGGRTDVTSREFFVGAIDEVRIYDRALSAEEVRQLYFTECTLSNIAGPTEVCQGDQNITFYVDPLENAQYKWEYSGLGTTINGDGNPLITIDFADNSTSGILTVTVTGDFIDAQIRSLFIQVQKLPSEAGIISGESEVCQGDTGILYTIPVIDNATSYNWNYNGTLFTSGSNSISLDFPANAIYGNLMVSGHNACGDGPASPPFAVTISQLPSDPGTISGVSTVCAGQQGVPYTIPAIQNATGYSWEYSGTTGVTINGNSNSVNLDFDGTAISGDLTVSGTNSCGNSATPAVLPITVLSIPAEAGMISGENPVCLNQNGVSYSVPSIDFASSYLWEYSGTGAILSGNSTSVIIVFSAQATGGNLSVAGQNTCGEGGRSPEFLITVNDCSVNPVEISIPNSFSPNGDGVNDVFFIRGLPENSTLIIFDRAGNTLFESLSYTNDWDGKDRAGKALASGTYWYVLSVSGQPEEYKGFVYLKK